MGRALFDHSVFARVSWSRAVGELSLLVLLGVAFANAAAWRRPAVATVREGS
ncbi:hypothetical protein [Rugosimonospora acidiphila]|uniref:hypothetical protein n=1 Tax=Rugosimonospora acidiphila TaxID=556531 RepID=UPI0031F0373B